jgi:hypothetical protein
MIRQWLMLGVVFALVALTLAYALASGGSKVCIKRPRNEPIGYPCNPNPCSGNCRWFIQPNGDCFAGDSKCEEADGIYEVDTFYTPCKVMNFPWNPTCGCDFNDVRVGPRMRYRLDDCKG